MPNKTLVRFFENMGLQGLMLTYDDVRMRTKHSNVLPKDTNVHSQFSRHISLNIPIVSSPMDTVTTAEMAIAVAEAGGIGIIHRGFSPEAQAKEVDRVKNRLNARIETPITVGENMKVSDILALREEKKYPFHTFPVISREGKVLGLVTGNDFDFCTDQSVYVIEIMTPVNRLIKASKKTESEEALNLMVKHKVKVLPLITKAGLLAGMYIFSDLKRIRSRSSSHNVDKNGQLIVGAAVGIGKGACDRADLLARKHCDLFHVDTAHGDSENVIETIRILKQYYPDIDVAAGNVSSGESAKRLVDAGADAIMVGQGPGSICTTRIIAGVGVPQVSAIYECVQALNGSGVPVCADGGINSSGDMVIALAVGAESVMLGRLLAGTEESPGETKYFQGRLVKDYRGMGSLGAMRDNASSRERYGQGGTTLTKVVPEGVEGVVPYKGSAQLVLEQYVGGIRAGLGYTGAHTLEELREVAEIFRISQAGINESYPHNMFITSEAPNYQGKS